MYKRHHYNPSNPLYIFKNSWPVPVIYFTAVNLLDRRRWDLLLISYRLTSYTWLCVSGTLSIVRVYSSLHWTSDFLQGTRKTRPCLSGQVVVSQIVASKEAACLRIFSTCMIKNLPRAVPEPKRKIIHHSNIVLSFVLSSHMISLINENTILQDV